MKDDPSAEEILDGALHHGVGPTHDVDEPQAYWDAARERGVTPHAIRVGVNPNPALDARRSWTERLKLVRRNIGHFIQFGARVVHLTVSMTDDAERRSLAPDVVSGELYERLRMLAHLPAAFPDLPFIVRVPEVNGSWNGHEPETLVAAWRYLRAVFKQVGADGKCRFDWSVCPSANDRLVDLMRWHPGARWVDGWSIDLFGWHFVRRRRENDAPALSIVDDFLYAARDARIPVAVPECAPTGHDLSTDDVWREWFEPFLRLRAAYGFSFCYSNRDFTRHRGLEKWGDMRIDDKPALADRWFAELA